ncbi:Type II toxin-antitoxin system Phd/YefM family antitoxin [Candidatus Trichorickettsia mobilis]|uniref:Antitoxin n=1 Tax=Candidatus Trichorickettsia mobilis TaxID=1346319 RepID=A0ABZ0UTC8_9RICK|nr:type II toxin-antitoxin system Phd/YefM family antitoxin [Candidatus Trichorickettsia mobilis]WPY01295.1 Type II toxin-antitoxin system Phd/YefM family antitoxin [Candidatus Trichorickettsia mobilis]
MQFVNMHDAKTNLSKYIDKINENHETIVICRNGIPVGQLIKYTPPKVRRIGILKNKIKVLDNFDSDLPDEIIGEYK